MKTTETTKLQHQQNVNNKKNEKATERQST